MKLEQALIKKKHNFFLVILKMNNGYLKQLNLPALYNLYRQNYCGCVYSYQDMLIREKNKELQK